MRSQLPRGACHTVHNAPVRPSKSPSSPVAPRLATQPGKRPYRDQLAHESSAFFPSFPPQPGYPEGFANCSTLVELLDVAVTYPCGQELSIEKRLSSEIATYLPAYPALSSSWSLGTFPQPAGYQTYPTACNPTVLPTRPPSNPNAAVSTHASAQEACAVDESCLEKTPSDSLHAANPAKVSSVFNLGFLGGSNAVPSRMVGWRPPPLSLSTQVPFLPVGLQMVVHTVAANEGLHPVPDVATHGLRTWTPLDNTLTLQQGSNALWLAPTVTTFVQWPNSATAVHPNTPTATNAKTHILLLYR